MSRSETARPCLYWSAGEASGDHHAAEVLRHLRESLPGLDHRGLGGEAMARAGLSLQVNMTRDFSIIGFTRAALAYPQLRRILHEAIRSWINDPPVAVVCVDYPGFNLVLARHAHALGIPVFWYISPQVWAWKVGRVKKMRRYLRRTFVILPFEEAFLRERGLQADYLGNPLLDELAPQLAPQPHARQALGLPEQATVIGLLPGSRTREITFHLPLLARTARLLLLRHPGLRFVLPIAPTVDESVIRKAIADNPDLPITLTTDSELARLSMDAAICKSGTSTLELAVAGVPMVIFYITSWLNALIARLVLTIPHIGLVNLVAGYEIARECVQSQANPNRLADELESLLPGTEGHARQCSQLAFVREKLGGPGSSARVAAELQKEIQLILENQPQHLSQPGR